VRLNGFPSGIVMRAFYFQRAQKASAPREKGEERGMILTILFILFLIFLLVGTFPGGPFPAYAPMFTVWILIAILGLKTGLLHL
jgi:hypothetical protein